MMVCASCGSEKVCRIAGTRLLCEECGKKRDAAIEEENELWAKGFVILVVGFIIFLIIAKFSGCK